MLARDHRLAEGRIMFYRWVEWNFDLYPLGERWIICNDITCQLVTLAQGGPF
jgi:hypothetical protein